MDATAMRCPCCDARALEPTQRRLATATGRVIDYAWACGHCGLLLADDAAAFPDLRRSLCEALKADAFPAATIDPRHLGWGLDIYTLRTAASALGRCARPRDEAQGYALSHPHSSLFADASLEDIRPDVVADLAIAILCRTDEWDQIRAIGRSLVARGFDVLVVVDCDDVRSPFEVDPSGISDRASLRRMNRPLDGDFAAQRNAAQLHAGRRWVLQIDADETLSEGFLETLGGLVAIAERDGVHSIGFARRNLVDGVLSDAYPDVQYRLNRASVRYEGVVHERPVVPGGWPQSFFALGGVIEHHLEAERVALRSQRYEAMAPGRGRLEEAVALMQPYRP